MRWAQSARGLCRRCERAGDTRTTHDRDVERLVVRDRPRTPVPIRTVVIGGRTYEVVWDGTTRE